ncbi:MAG: c-type cytochrome [Methylovirgula sp.]|uniref:c-type cytochrome n=1 Tax=Methylovirgula sp. TaxID=1978224 RepID=UPI0030765899
MVKGAVKVVVGLCLAFGLTFAISARADDTANESPTKVATDATKVGSLVNPYQAKEDAHDQALADEGHKLFGNFGCPGCHGYGGGGGMCPPITNGVWIYGDKDDTLFRLISLGSDALQKEGFTRQATENIVAPMPPMGGVITNADDLWKIIAWIKIQAAANVKANPQ